MYLGIARYSEYYMYLTCTLHVPYRYLNGGKRCKRLL